LIRIKAPIANAVDGLTELTTALRVPGLQTKKDKT
jgi:hypothetical protein